MAWRIIQQPDGLFARFSTVVDMFTVYDMTYNEAVELCRDEYDMGRKESIAKVQRAIDERRTRWIDALDIIQAVHGKQKRRDVVAAICRKQHWRIEAK